MILFSPRAKYSKLSNESSEILSLYECSEDIYAHTAPHVVASLSGPPYSNGRRRTSPCKGMYTANYLEKCVIHSWYRPVVKTVFFGGFGLSYKLPFDRMMVLSGSSEMVNKR